MPCRQTCINQCRDCGFDKQLAFCTCPVFNLCIIYVQVIMLVPLLFQNFENGLVDCFFIKTGIA